MIQRMAQEFSSRITYELVTLSYPYEADLRVSFKDKILTRFLPVTTSGQSLTQTLSSFQPHVAYTDSPYYAAQFQFISRLKAKRIPLVLQLRGDWWREYRDWFLSATWTKRLLSIQKLAFQSGGARLANKITPICKWLDQIVKQHIPNKQTEVVYQGVDPAQFYPESGLSFRKPAVAIIQNHTVYGKVAGLLNFYRVMARLPEIQFYIAEGEEVDQSFLPMIKQRFLRLSNVHFVPGINSIGAVRRMLTACDCYVLASGLDCCPTTVLEASLMSKPVIASRVGGVPEIVLENKTGWTVGNDQVEMWVEKIKLGATDSRLSRTLGHKGRDWVAENFDWATVSKQVENILIKEAS